MNLHQPRNTIALTIASALLVSSFLLSIDDTHSQAFAQHCVTTNKGVVVNAGRCPSGTKKWAKILTFRKLKRACKLPRRTTVGQLRTTSKLLFHQVQRHNGKVVGCAAQWKICTNCKLLN